MSTHTVPPSLDQLSIEGPFLSVATLCRSGTLDLKNLCLEGVGTQRFVHNSMEPTIQAPLYFVVCLLAGTSLARHRVVIDIDYPSKRSMRNACDCAFSMEHRQWAVAFPTPPLEAEGTHWFSVKVDDRLIARAPLEVVRLIPQGGLN